MIKLDNISVAYTVGNVVLKDISLDINNNGIVTIIGKSGSGKSSMLKLLNGLLPPYQGDYFFDNHIVYKLSDAERKKVCTQRIGYVWQNYRLIPEINVYKNIILPSYISNMPIDRKYFDDLCSLLGIDKYLNQYPDKLSGGEQQRVAMARALILKPKVIIADEPTGALDSKTAAKVTELILMSKERFKTLFIIATHNNDLAALGDRIIEISDGRIISDVSK